LKHHSWGTLDVTLEPALNCPFMKLFKIEVTTRRGVLDVLVHADSAEQVEQHVAGKFTGSKIGKPLELPDVPKHFVLAELEE
jgi:aromatic ring-cleaving dioxygenase